MTANSDPTKDQYDDMDFSDAKTVSQTPALAALQATHTGDNKARITMRVDRATLAQFKAKAAENGGSY
jgi:predicted DNA binding CopG/RHH family protein